MDTHSLLVGSLEAKEDLASTKGSGEVAPVKEKTNTSVPATGEPKKGDAEPRGLDQRAFSKKANEQTVRCNINHCSVAQWGIKSRAVYFNIYILDKVY